MCFFSSAVKLGLLRIAFQPLLPPALLGRVGAVHELGADGAAVGFAQRLHDLAQGHVLGLGEIGVRWPLNVMSMSDSVRS
jgi:hypothetical protein